LLVRPDPVTSAQQDQLRNRISTDPDDGVLVKVAANLFGGIELQAQREVALLSGPFRTVLAAGALDGSERLVAQHRGQLGVPAVVGFVGLNGPARVVGGQEGAACDAAGSEQGRQALRALANVQDDVVLSVADPVVGGQVGARTLSECICVVSDIKKPSRESVEGRRISRLVAPARAASAFASTLPGGRLVRPWDLVSMQIEV
jgi:hypothetical protein